MSNEQRPPWVVDLKNAITRGSVAIIGTSLRLPDDLPHIVRLDGVGVPRTLTGSAREIEIPLLLAANGRELVYLSADGHARIAPGLTPADLERVLSDFNDWTPMLVRAVYRNARGVAA